MDFFNSDLELFQILGDTSGAGLGAWGAINLLEGYSNENTGAKLQGHEVLDIQAVVTKREMHNSDGAVEKGSKKASCSL